MSGMLAGMDTELFGLWREYAELEPFGETRADLRAGIVASTIANVFRAQNKPPIPASRFMPDFEKRARPKQPMGAAQFSSFLGQLKEAARRGKT